MDALTRENGAARRRLEDRPSDIAVIGLGAMLPKAPSARQFWDNIVNAVDAISEIPAHRWDWRLYFDADRSAPDKIYSKWGGFLDDVPFDPLRYGIPPTAIKAVDPLQLMTLEVVRQALEDAGYGSGEFDREKVSIILGASGGAGDVGAQYAVRAETPRFAGTLDEDQAARLPSWTEDSFAGILLNVAAGRAANRFDFGGVNYTVDAACASSLTAVYQGVTELECGRSDMVVVGGVDTVQGPFGYLCFSKTQALSPRGRCSTFDTSADGIVISEGIAMVVLKRLEDAERDGDRVYAVIKGVGGSSDGRARSMTAPHPDGQIRALERAYQSAGYSPASVGLFEAHGTGTVAGDTAELETVTRLLGNAGARPKHAAIGSVKTLIGHTKATAGVAGLIKSALALYHKVLPPHANVTEPNARISDPNSPLYLMRDAQPWVTNAALPRRASVSAFGFGGTNFHVTLEEHRSDLPQGEGTAALNTWPAELLVWRAQDASGLADQIEGLAASIDASNPPCLRDLSWTLCKRLGEPGPTAALVLRAQDNLTVCLEMLAAHIRSPEGKPLPPQASYSVEPLAAQGRLAVMFAGQGSQYPNMLREVALNFPEIPAVMARADALLAEPLRASMGEGARLSSFIYTAGLYTPEQEQDATRTLMRPDFAQPALGVVEAGLWQLMQRFGVEADMAAGHSYGEYAALYAAGVLDLESLIRVSEARGRFIVEASEGGDLGAMAAVQADREAVERVAQAYPDLLVANHNSPVQSILSGSRESIDAVVDRLTAAGMDARRLQVGAAFHSPFVSPAQTELADFIAGLDFGTPAFPVYSNTTARPHEDNPDGIRHTLAEHLGSPVEFVAEVEAMYGDGARIFVGLGPKNVQASLIDQILGSRPHRVVRIDDHEGGLRGLLAGLGALLAEGVDLDLGPLFENRDCRELDLEDLNANRRTPEVAEHMWLLNGSAARRAMDPPPVPLTLDEVERREAAQATGEQQASAPREPGPAQPEGVDKRSNNAQRQFKENIVSDNPSPTSGVEGQAHAGYVSSPMLDGERESVLALYQDTMRQFLKTQENVMTAYLTGAAPQRSADAGGILLAARRAAPRVRRLATPVVQEVAPAPGAAIPSAPVAPAAAAPPPPAPAAPAAVPTPVHAKAAPGPTLAPAAPVTAAPSAATGSADGDSVKQLLLEIVEERTGYPQSMLGLDQNLEADLGIDSIKRVEIVGALAKQLPAQVLAGREEEATEALNSQKTLQGIIDWLSESLPQKEAAIAPFELTGAESGAALPRFVMQAQSENVDGLSLDELPAGLYLVTADESGVADALIGRLEESGLAAVRVVLDAVEDEARLAAAVDAARRLHGPVRGLCHLAPISAPFLDPAPAGVGAWREQTRRFEFSLARLLQLTADDLRDGGRVLAASALGGTFGRSGLPARGISAQGGAVGLLKSLREEWQGLKAKAVDIDPRRDAADNAGYLLSELCLPGGRVEVGYPDGERTIFRSVAAPVGDDAGELADDARMPDAGWVVLATGGARGVTAEVLHGLAAYGLTLVLVGRKPEPEPEDPLLAGLDANGLRDRLLAQARESEQPLRPVDVQRMVASQLQDREIRANLKEFRDAGARVEYRVCDVRDEAQVAALMDDLYTRHRRLDGVVHGAGIIEDKLLVDKSMESWARVFDTKVDSAFLLAANLRPEHLRFFVMFASVAGRYGNSGQTDYATANELLNRLAWQLRERWDGHVKVAAMNWGPWEGSRHGQGMVSPETRRKFEDRGVGLVPAADGAQAFLDEVLLAPLAQAEVVSGEGPWETHESDAGAFVRRRENAHERAQLPLLFGAVREDHDDGGASFARRIDVAHDHYLTQHLLDDVPVLPAAVALELFAEAAASLYPDLYVTELRDLRVMRGLRLEEGGFDARLSVSPRRDSDPAGAVELSMELATAGSEGPPHYRATVSLRDAPVGAGDYRSVLHPGASPVSARDAYRERLFHGPCFQVLTELSSLDEHGALARVKPSDPRDWIPDAPFAGRWLFDPAMMDSAPQMALLWAYATGSESALPSRFGRVRRFGVEPVGECQMHFLVYPDRPPHQVRADVAFVDASGVLRLLIEQLECTSSPALNRLGGGWKGEICV